jgi:hypothetical protein
MTQKLSVEALKPLAVVRALLVCLVGSVHVHPGLVHSVLNVALCPATATLHRADLADSWSSSTIHANSFLDQ